MADWGTTAPRDADDPSRIHAEHIIAVGWSLTRAAVLIAAIPSIVAGRPAHPALAVPYLFVAVAVVAFSIAMVTVTLRRRELVPPSWGYVDAALSAVALTLTAVLMTRTQADATAALTWSAAITGNACAAVGAWARRRTQLALVPVLVVVYTVVALLVDSPHWPQILTNVVLWLGFAATARLVCSTWRELASEADTLRAQAARDAERQTLDRARIVVHDPAAILRMIADPATPGASLEALRKQAAQEANRLRTFMSDHAATTASEQEGRTVAHAIRAGLGGFEDLPLEVAVDLAEDCAIDTGTHDALQQAVATTLHNVREHAAAHLVVVHADADDDWWEVTVRDDGRGFDPESATYGHGLRTLVRDNLAAHGVRTRLESAPGEGCAVILMYGEPAR